MSGLHTNKLYIYAKRSIFANKLLAVDSSKDRIYTFCIILIKKKKKPQFISVKNITIVNSKLQMVKYNVLNSLKFCC